MGVVTIEIPVDEDAAVDLADPNRRDAVGRLISRLLRPTAEDNPLAWILDAASRDAENAGLTQQDIDDELAEWKAERMARPG